MEKVMPLTSDHNDTDASSFAQLDGAHDLFARGIQHADTAHKGEISLMNTEKHGVVGETWILPFF